MSKLEKLKEKARSLEGKDPKGAIEAWLGILKGQDEDGDPNPDLVIFNRIGDLYLKLRDPAQAADFYDQAVDKYAEPERRPGAGTVTPAPPKAQPHDDPAKSGKRKTSSLVFLDVDAPPVGKAPVKGRVPLPPKPALEPEAVAESLIEPVTAEPDTSLEIEATSLVEGLEPATGEGTLEGFETTSAEFGDIQLDAQEVPSLQDEVSPEDIPPPAEFEPTMAEEESSPESAPELEPLLETETEIEPPKAKAAPPVAPVVPKRPAVGAPPRFGGGGAGARPSGPPEVRPVDRKSTA